MIFVLIDSDPPLRIIELPDLMLRAEASMVTFGLDSYIIAITPKGIDIFPTLMPLDIVFNSLISPTGSSIAIISFMLSIIASIRESSNKSLSINDFAKFLSFFKISISLEFSSLIEILLFSISIIRLFRIEFLTS